MNLHVGVRSGGCDARKSRRVCEHINTSKDLWYRELRTPPLSPFALSLSSHLLRREKAKEARGMAKCAENPNGVPCGTQRGPGLSQRPLEQMDSISYFVTPPLRRARGFTVHPRTCDLFRRHISRLNAPPPLRAQLERALLFPFFVRPPSSRDPRCSRTVGRSVFAPADFCPLQDVITQQSGLFRAYSSADR